MKARAEIMRAVLTAHGWNLSQKAAAKLGVTQPRLNDLLLGKIDRLSLDVLLDLPAHAGLRICIALKQAA